jgi:hypothetical protein
MRCLIRWIDSSGKPTPDSNDAVAMVKLTTAYRPDWIPICMDHLARFENDRERMIETGWRAMPIVPSCRCWPNTNHGHMPGCPKFKP